MIFQMESQIAGIPCLIAVNNYFKQAAQGRSSWSDWDADGYFEAEFDVLDRKGYQADWLARKMTDKDEDRIIAEIQNYTSN